MRIADRIMLIGGGETGTMMSHALDCNIYLIDCHSEFVMIDAGSGVEPERIVRNIESAGVDMKKVSHLLLTHAHGDHAAGAAFFRDTFGMSVVCPQEAKAWLENADEDKLSIGRAKRAGIYPEHFRFPPCSVDDAVGENDELNIGNAVFRVIETPGHSRGHVSYLWNDGGTVRLFSGDTVFSGGKISLQNIWDCSIQAYAQTVGKLHALRVDQLFPGHGPFLLRDSWKHIEKAHTAFERLALPANI